MVSTPPVRQNNKRNPSYSTPAGGLWIQAHRSSLPNDEWVAATSAGMVAHGPSFEDFYDRLSALNIPKDLVTIAFITEDSA